MFWVSICSLRCRIEFSVVGKDCLLESMNFMIVFECVINGFSRCC